MINIFISKIKRIRKSEIYQVTTKLLLISNDDFTIDIDFDKK